MRIEIEQNPDISQYLNVLKRTEFPQENNLREKILDCVLRFQSNITPETYRDAPSQHIEMEMATSWAKEFVNKSEGFKIDITDWDEYMRQITLETCKLAISPKTFQELIVKTFNHGSDMATRLEQQKIADKERLKQNIKKEIESLKGLSPDEIKKEVNNIIEQHI